jgi:hypothetical protein
MKLIALNRGRYMIGWLIVQIARSIDGSKVTSTALNICNDKKAILKICHRISP